MSPVVPSDPFLDIHPAMRDHILVYINGERLAIRGGDCRLTVSEFLRRRLGLVGTKIVCSEGDCGSCTVLVGSSDGERLQYRSIDSCIAFMFQLDSQHIVTIEGLAEPGELTRVQESLVGCHASQCGFCTPGFVMSMTGLVEGNSSLGDDQWRAGLTGNLCRCTGYVSIIEAGKQLGGVQFPRLDDRYPPAMILRDFATSLQVPYEISESLSNRNARIFGPTCLSDALKFLDRNRTAKIVAGATDMGVQLNKGAPAPEVILDLNRIEELDVAEIEHGPEGAVIVAGARTTWSKLKGLCSAEVPEFARIISIFGSPQIRHMGTFGGNLINASPIADSLPFLFVMESELELSSVRGTRKVSITEFFRGYKQIDLQPGEILSCIRVPVPSPAQALRLYKVSRRRDLDVSTFTAAILCELEGDHIKEVRVAFGGVGPTVVRAYQTEEFLRGKDFNESTMRAAGDLAIREITPISDVRGGADYRFQLTRNVLLKFFHQHRASQSEVTSHA